MKKITLVVFLFFASAFFAGIYLGANLKNVKGLMGSTDFNEITTTSKATITTSTTLAQQLLPANTARKYAIISNSSDTGVMLTLGATTTATINNGIWIPAGGRFELDDTNLYKGIITIGTTTAGKIISAVEAY